MDPTQRPVITQHDLDQARLDQLAATVKAVGTTLGFTGLNYRFNAPFGPVVQKPLQMFVTGVKVTPTDAGRAAVSLPKASIVAGLLPGPLGYIPGEIYGLHPSVVRRELGFDAGKKPILFEATPERVRVYEAKIEAERIAARALNTEVVLGLASGFPAGRLPPGPLQITPEELTYLESLPAGTSNAQQLLPALRERRGDFLPSERLRLAPEVRIPGVRYPSAVGAGATVPSASIQPELIQPVNAKALENQANAEGIRKVLVHERADP